MCHQQVSGDTKVGEFADMPEGFAVLETDLNRLEEWGILPLLFSTGEAVSVELDFLVQEGCGCTGESPMKGL